MMHLKNILVLFIVVLLSIQGKAQSAYLLPGMKEEWMLNRMEIKYRYGLRFTSIRPYKRSDVVNALDGSDTSGIVIMDMPQKMLPSRIDRYNINSFLMANSEWSAPDSSFKSKRPILKHFYKNKANAFEIENEDFHLIFNPIIQYQQYKEKNNDENVFLNSRGLQVRGLIEKKIGFSFYFTENQERMPKYATAWATRFKAVPGAGFIKQFKNTGYDYFDTRASVSWKVANFLDMQLGYDRNFIGNGYRSLFLSDFSNNYMFLKLNTHFSRFHYQNIFAELFPSHQLTGDRIYPRKYYRANYLNFSATNWLNLGLFEGTMLGRNNRLPLALFNPVIYLPIESNKNGIRDRHYVGFDIKANLLRRFQVYGQLMVDRFNKDGWSDKTWDNRFGYQAGLKYIDVFGVRNVDLQVEVNRVRPYTYAANDTLTNYTHYNQPLAHPLGANFSEGIVILRAHPFKKLYLQGKMIYYYQGLDLGTLNLGSNVFGGFNNRLSDVRVRIGDGDRATCMIASFLVSYELKENLFIDASFTKRDYETLITGVNNTTFMSIGLRWNMARREFDF
jgi:hypothetical protein